MAADEIEAVVVVQSADLYYFTGSIQAGTLVIPAEGRGVFMVRRDVNRAQRESAFGAVEPVASFREIPAILERHGLSAALTGKVGFELDVVPVSHFERLRAVFPDATPVDVGLTIRKVRSIKSPFEVALIRRAAAQSNRIQLAAREIVREGMTQVELAAELERLGRLDGHPGPVRMRSFNGGLHYGHVMAGPDAAVPASVDTPLGGVGAHPSAGQGASFAKILRGHPIIVDWGGFAGGYVSDETRVLCLGGLPDHLARAYQDMLDVQSLMKTVAKPGVPWAAIYRCCLELASERGHGDRFMGAAPAQVSFVGHGLGIEIDEPPFLARGFDKDVLEEGMVFALEPKAVFPGEGPVGIENTFLVTATGVEQITFTDEAIAVLS
jgi:Xaa-Pro dipeptidase